MYYLCYFIFGNGVLCGNGTGDRVMSEATIFGATGVVKRPVRRNGPAIVRVGEVDVKVFSAQIEGAGFSTENVRVDDSVELSYYQTPDGTFCCDRLQVVAGYLAPNFHDEEQVETKDDRALVRVTRTRGPRSVWFRIYSVVEGELDDVLHDHIPEGNASVSLLGHAEEKKAKKAA